MDGAFTSEHATPAVDKGATQSSGIEAHGNLIRKTGEHATLDRAGLYFAGLQIESFAAGNAEKLVGELGGFAIGRASCRERVLTGV